MSTPANFNNARPVIDPDNAVMLLIDMAVLRPWQARANRWRLDAP